MSRDVRFSPPVSTRYPERTLERLRTLAQAGQETVSGLIQRYVEEGSRVDEHPGIVFRSGPAGRRAGLPGGPDVWEVVALVREFADDADAEAAVERAAAWLSLTASQVRAALGYYGAFPEEIEGQIALNRQAAEAAERALSQVARAGGVRLLLDELFPAEIARALRNLGHEVRAIQEEPARRGLPDAEVLALAIRQGRALLTENARDFRPLAAALQERGEAHAGLILTSNRRYPRASADTLGRLVRDLDELCRTHPEQPANLELWL